MKQAMSKARETVQRLATDHRDLHSTVSKVGKAIDRVSISSVYSLRVYFDLTVKKSINCCTLLFIYY